MNSDDSQSCVASIKYTNPPQADDPYCTSLETYDWVSVRDDTFLSCDIE